jgi:hypothetical protein
MKEEGRKKAASELKRATALANGRRSPDPKTEEGKARASANSYKHGFYATHIFPTKKAYEQDAPFYNTLITGLYEHYAPKSWMEKFLVEKIVAHELCFVRLLEREQKYMSLGGIDTSVTERTARTATSISRRLEKLTQTLERLQEKRAGKQPTRS